MRIIAIANQKGGCGKTTTAINLSSSLAMKSQRVLLVDCDPQSHATMGLNIDADLDKSMYHVLTTKDSARLAIDDVVVPIKEGFDLAPANIMLNALEQEFSGLNGREERLLRALRATRTRYDFMILDCPPSIGHLCFNALRACTEVIIPIDMSLFSLRGVAKLMDIVIMLKDACGHLVRTRALITMYDYRTRYARRVLEKVREQFKDNVFNTVIRYNIRLRETVDYGLPVGDYDKHSLGHQDYEKLTEEILQATKLQAVGGSAAVQDASHIREQTEHYLAQAAALPGGEGLDPEMDELFAHPYGSLYGEMINTLAAGSADLFPEDEE